eukprot:CAMPEP_0167765466 /NCGR_PEP_ID=MMETSP0110_2-20121227/14707_1 /TAXON_ID=629695 /ORGANISM="Gymnochlora sp., Strain CCMP2014" /LENGTH=1285 /DNA_ID=CAMNT_0007653191 /DNA_START=170 /DNA_END=4025 /DNA_ORIENTATION=+
MGNKIWKFVLAVSKIEKKGNQATILGVRIPGRQDEAIISMSLKSDNVIFGHLRLRNDREPTAFVSLKLSTNKRQAAVDESKEKIPRKRRRLEERRITQGHDIPSSSHGKKRGSSKKRNLESILSSLESYEDSDDDIANSSKEAIEAKDESLDVPRRTIELHSLESYMESSDEDKQERKEETKRKINVENESMKTSTETENSTVKPQKNYSNGGNSSSGQFYPQDRFLKRRLRKYKSSTSPLDKAMETWKKANPKEEKEKEPSAQLFRIPRRLKPSPYNPDPFSKKKRTLEFVVKGPQSMFPGSDAIVEVWTILRNEDGKDEESQRMINSSGGNTSVLRRKRAGLVLGTERVKLHLVLHAPEQAFNVEEKDDYIIWDGGRLESMGDFPLSCTPEAKCKRYRLKVDVKDDCTGLRLCRLFFNVDVVDEKKVVENKVAEDQGQKINEADKGKRLKTKKKSLGTRVALSDESYETRLQKLLHKAFPSIPEGAAEIIIGKHMEMDLDKDTFLDRDETDGVVYIRQCEADSEGRVSLASHAAYLLQDHRWKEWRRPTSISSEDSTSNKSQEKYMKIKKPEDFAQSSMKVKSLEEESSVRRVAACYASADAGSVVISNWRQSLSGFGIKILDLMVRRRRIRLNRRHAPTIHCDVLVVFWSQAASEDVEMRNEWEEAITRGIRVQTVLLQGADNVPPFPRELRDKSLIRLKDHSSRIEKLPASSTISQSSKMEEDSNSQTRQKTINLGYRAAYLYFKYHILDYNTILGDGFYDGGRSRGWQELPPLDSLKDGGKFPIEDCNGREVVFVDSKVDGELEQLKSQIRKKFVEEFGVGGRKGDVRSVILFLANIVRNSFGGFATQPMMRWCDKRVKWLLQKHNSIAIPLMAIKPGVCRHRSLLFKYLADALRHDMKLAPNLKVRLVRGSHAGGGHAWNVALIDGVHTVVDLMRPGTQPFLYAADSEMANQYRRNGGTVGADSVISSEIAQALTSPIASVSSVEANTTKNGKLPDIPSIELDWGEGGLGQAELLGEGGFGSVRMAQWRGLDVAVKAMPPKMGNTAFWKEVKVLAELRHPNIVQTLAICSRAPAPLIIMEKLKMSLHDRLYKIVGGRVPWNFKQSQYARKKIGNILLQVAQALCFLHENKPAVIHQDLKPQNVLLDAYGNAKLCDFGISQILLKHLPKSDPGVRLPEVFGSPPYAAPELFEGFSNVGVDIYAFGILTWELVSGRRPWEGCPDIARRVKSGERPSLSHVGTQPLSRFISACWHHKPNNRPTCRQIMHALKKLGAAVPETV